MKTIVFYAGLFLLLGTVAVAAPKTFIGQIMDNFCATAGSHKSMYTGKGDPNSPGARRQCTLKCVAMGGKFVLYNKATKTTYKLDDQEKPREFAAEKVKVTGAYDPSTMTIHVESIRKAAL
jgi:hypothetical protein